MEALSWHAWTATPFELAPTELCFGEHLRRHAHRADPRAHLHLAKVYRKLDLRSRTELARWVAGQQGGTASAVARRQR